MEYRSDDDEEAEKDQLNDKTDHNDVITQRDLAGGFGRGHHSAAATLDKE